MAAQTNPNAQAPVSLALLKLGVFFTWEWIQEVWKQTVYKPLYAIVWDVCLSVRSILSSLSCKVPDKTNQ